MMFSGDTTVLVIAAHPDDEVLGVGGTIRRHVDAGASVHILIVTEGTTAQYDDAAIIEQKRTQARESAGILGVGHEEGGGSIRFGECPDMRLDTLAHTELNAIIEDAIAAVEPDTVYTHTASGLNEDHRQIHHSTLVAARPHSGVADIYGYFVGSSTEWAPSTPGFDPRLFVTIDETIETKIEALACYATEIRPYPHPRSPKRVREYAAYFGGHVGARYAEAFEVVRTRR
jgi:LmbE family N-acetylglucosaminyl deacetylase